MKTDFDFAIGELLLFDKPYEWTSFDVVKKIRNTIKVKKVGHAGTLDPLATGLLILCTGKKTKQINKIQEQVKEYEGKMIIGTTTPSFDLETVPENKKDISLIQESDIRDLTKKFIGEISQVPPIYSALKVNGKRAYESTRKGEEVKMKARQVQIHSFIITKIKLPEISFTVSCSKGTYIRSLTNDFGEILGVGAHLSALRRTKIGDYTIENSYQIQDFVELIKKNSLTENPY